MAEPGEPLSDREYAVLERLAAGSTNREIARDLDISPNTVKVHLRNIFAKLDVSSRTEATTVAIQKGLLRMPGVEVETAEPLAPRETDIALESDFLPGPDQDTPAVRRPTSSQWPLIATLLIVLIILMAGVLAVTLLTNGDAGVTSEEPGPTLEPFVPERLDSANWYAERPLPRERSAMALSSVGLDLYLIGGDVDAGVVNLVDVYETDNHHWRTAASKPTAVADATAAVLFGEIYVPGGRLADNRPTSVVEAYSPANDAWRPVAPLPQPIAGALALTDGSLLYVIGGWDGEAYLTTVYVYNPDEDSWRELPAMTHGRANATGGVVGDRLYVVGGWDGEDDLAVCETYDPAAESWSECPDMSLPRGGAGATVLSNRLLYVLGGGIHGQVLTGEVYDADSELWKPIELPLSEGTTAWHHLGVVNVETRVFALGGRQGEKIVDWNYVYEPFAYRTYLPTVGGDS